MNIKSIVLSAVAATGLLVSVSAASAAVIDFTAATTGTSGTVAGVAWSMTSTFGALNNTQAYDGGPTPTNSFGLAFGKDGYGVDDDEISNDELDGGETIVVTFVKAVKVTGFAFLDIFKNMRAPTGESGIMTINGIDYITGFTGLPGGYAELTALSIITKTVTFSAGLLNDGLGVADGALAALEVAPVPVPAAGLLMLTAVGGVAALRRRKS